MPEFFMQIPNPWVQPAVSIPDAGRVLHLSRSAAYRAAAAGTLPTVPIGGRRMVATASLYRMVGLPLPAAPGRGPTPRVITL